MKLFLEGRRFQLGSWLIGDGVRVRFGSGGVEAKIDLDIVYFRIYYVVKGGKRLF